MRAVCAAVILAFGLACGGAVDSVSETFSGVEMPTPMPPPDSKAAPASAPAPVGLAAEVAGAYTANAYGMCRKYADCGCSAFETVEACVADFGDTKDAFPPDVWACILARDCEGLCEFNPGTCFELYALQYTKGSKKGASDCPAGTFPIEIYDLHGDYVRTECRE